MVRQLSQNSLAIWTESTWKDARVTFSPPTRSMSQHGQPCPASSQATKGLMGSSSHSSRPAIQRSQPFPKRMGRWLMCKRLGLSCNKSQSGTAYHLEDRESVG